MIIDKKLGAACRRLNVSRFNREELCSLSQIIKVDGVRFWVSYSISKFFFQKYILREEN